MILGRKGHRYRPFAVVYLPMVEPSKRVPLRSAVEAEVSAW
jgi:hypothetical protein